MTPIVRNIQNNDLYSFLGGTTFVNLRTGKRGEVNEDKAKEVFKFNIEATEMINEYPIIELMVKQLQLKFEK